MQTYSDPSRETDPHALPDVEIFWLNYCDDPRHGTPCLHLADQTVKMCDACREECDSRYEKTGWFYWSCFPGCLPDSDPIGPFASEAEALADMRDNWRPEESEWSGSPDPADPDNYWIDDVTGERVDARTGARSLR